MSIDLILAHSGDRFPDHINDCIELASRQNFQIHLILEKKFHNKINQSKIQLAELESVSNSNYKQYHLNNYDAHFRSGFFYRTSSRFILIDNYIKLNDIKSCFHIENDIAIFSDLIKVQFILDNSPHDTAIIMDNPLRCVPSIIWYKNHVASNRLANFIYSNNNLDDMKNLAIYFHQYRNYVTNLPIVPFDLINQEYNINFGNMYHEFESIFDGAAIGQYMYGIDNPADTNGFINETTIYNMSKLCPVLKNNIPEANQDNKKVKINNLHMHCKNLNQLL